LLIDAGNNPKFVWKIVEISLLIYDLRTSASNRGNEVLEAPIPLMVSFVYFCPFSFLSFFGVIALFDSSA